MNSASSTDRIPFAEITDAAARRPSPALSLNLSSNNPFRNRTNSPALASPALTSPASLPTPTIQSARPASRNPFLSAFESDAANKDSLGSLAPATAHMASGDTATSSSPRKTAFDSSTKELFDNLTLSDKPAQNGRPQLAAGPKRSETLPVRGHRPTRSGDDGKAGPDGARRPSRPRGPPQASDPFASPERRDRRDLNGPGPRPRRTNSESSRHGPMTEEEKRARDQRRRDRERRHRERGDKPRDGKSTRSRKPNGGLDLIDKLDVTGIYGPALFHHDGPFDACNPQRNRKKDTRAPMQAFPTDSKNNTIGGSGPLNKTFDMNRIHGTGAEGYEDFAAAPAGDGYQTQSGRKYSWERERPGVYDPFTRVELQHGEETVGLGTSTFLEGTQASRSAMQRKESENDTPTLQNTRRGPAVMNNGGDGLQRKRSLVQRIRGMSQPRRAGFEPGAASASTGAQEPSSPNGIPARKASTSATVRQVYPASAGGRIGAGQSETNPFFNDYNDAYEKKGASIKIAEQGQTGPKDKPLPIQPNSPTETTPLERRGTGDADAEYMTRNTSNGAVQPAPAAGGGIGGGFMSRVKSLKGRKGKV